MSINIGILRLFDILFEVLFLLALVCCKRILLMQHRFKHSFITDTTQHNRLSAVEVLTGCSLSYLVRICILICHVYVESADTSTCAIHAYSHGLGLILILTVVLIILKIFVFSRLPVWTDHLINHLIFI